MVVGTYFVFVNHMAIFSLQNNKIYRIEVRFQPGIPRIEILGSSAKSIKDAAIKAKLLLQQLGLRTPRNKKVYICIDPFVSSHDGLELGIFFAMKQAIENSQVEGFVFGNVSFDGQTSSSKKESELLPYIPSGMEYIIGSKKINVTHKIVWQKKSKAKDILWAPNIGPTLLSALNNKESVLFLVTNNSQVDDFILNLMEIYFEMHNEPIRVYSDLEKKNSITQCETNYIAVGKICPCGELKSLDRGACKFSRKKCESYFKNMNLNGRRTLVVTINENDLIKMKIDFVINNYPVHGLSSAITGEDRVWMESILKNIAIKEQRSAQTILFLSLKYYKSLSLKWM